MAKSSKAQNSVRAKKPAKGKGTGKSERLDLRVASDVKAKIEQAARLSGQSVSSFVLDATVRRAMNVIRESHVITLSARDRDRFLAELDRDDAEPNAALRRTAERYKTATR